MRVMHTSRTQSADLNGFPRDTRGAGCGGSLYLTRLLALLSR